MKDTFLTTEVHNRFQQLPPAKQTIMEIMRLTVEVTRELDKDGPEGVNEFLAVCAAQRGMH